MTEKGSGGTTGRGTVIPLRSRAQPVMAAGAILSQQPGREPTGEDVVAILLACAPAGFLRDLDLSGESSAEWAYVIESNRTALERLQASGSSSRKARVEAGDQRLDYSGLAGLALAYAFLKRTWVRVNPQARDTFWQVAAPPDVLLQFGESLRCEIEDREAGIIDDQDRHYGALVVDLKAQRDAARAENEALKAAETQGKRKRSDDARKGSKARWAEDGAGGKPADKAKAKYLPRMLAWVKAHRTPESAKNACVRHFLPMIEEEFGSDAPESKTVRSWLQGK